MYINVWHLVENGAKRLTAIHPGGETVEIAYVAANDFVVQVGAVRIHFDPAERIDVEQLT